jgi:hypothetical protein
MDDVITFAASAPSTKNYFVKTRASLHWQAQNVLQIRIWDHRTPELLSIASSWDRAPHMCPKSGSSTADRNKSKNTRGTFGCQPSFNAWNCVEEVHFALPGVSLSRRRVVACLSDGAHIGLLHRA